MKTGDMRTKGLYIGTGAGLILFVLVGLLTGSLIGGVIGLKIAGSIFGEPLQSALLPRLIVAVSMIGGVIVSAIVFVVGTSILGWSTGFVVDMLRKEKEAVAQEVVTK